MKFIVRSTINGYEAKWWLDDPQQTVIRFILPENTVEAWQLAVKRLTNDGLPRGVRDWLFSPAANFHTCEFGFNLQEIDLKREAIILERLAFCKFLLAWKSVGEDTLSTLDIFQENMQVRNFLRQWPFNWLFLSPLGDLFPPDQKNDLEETLRLYAEEGRWSLDLEMHASDSDQKMQFLGDFFPNLDLLKELAREEANQWPAYANMIMNMYAALLQSTLSFLQDMVNSVVPELRLQAVRFERKYLPILCALLVENESLLLEERQKYLNAIFERKVPEEKRQTLLLDVLKDLEDEAASNTEANHSLETIASLMAQHYLERYAVDDALTIWGKVQHLKKDGVMKGILGLYRSPILYFGLMFSWINLSLIPVAWVQLGMGLITLVVLFVISLFALGIAIARFQTRKGFSYLELFLPRLVGAGFVGLSILALESTVWDVSAKLPTFSWLFVVLAAYTGSLAYIFLNVHKTTRLLPVMDPLESQRKPKRRNHPQVSYIMTRSVKTAGRIFAIGALEAMGLTIFIASFLPLDQVFDGIPLTILNWHGLLLQIWSPHGVIIQWDHFLRLTYFPKIIILWAGLALLIGAFVQLLWQDRQITAS